MQPVSLNLAKRIVADVHAGLAPLEALPLKVEEQEAYLSFLKRLSPRYPRHVRLYRDEPKPHKPQGDSLYLAFPPWPGEVQVRTAYELAVERFLEYLEKQGYAVLSRNPNGAQLYAPKPLDLERTWQNFLEEYLGRDNLQKTLGVLLNSVRLARRGFSAPKVPVVTEGVRRFLAAWYRESLLTVKERLEKKRERLENLQQEEEEKYRSALKTGLENLLKKAQPKDKSRIQAYLDLALRQGWDPFRFLEEVLKSKPEALKREVGQLARGFGTVAKSQLATEVGNKFAKVLTEFLWVLDVPVPEERVPCLVQSASDGTTRNLEAKSAGDKGNKRNPFCYGCGRPLDGQGYKASKLVFASPSQRLQSGTHQEEPRVCTTCAAVSLASPVKPGEGSALVWVDPKGSAEFAASEQAHQFARLLVTGTLHVAAGRYIQLNSPPVGQGEKQKPLAQALGRVVYTLAYLGQEVNLRVIRGMEFYLLEGSQKIFLPRRALWLSKALQQAFGACLEEEGKANRDLGEALRLILVDKPFHAEYVLAKRYRTVSHPYILEESRADYLQLLEEERMSKLAERYKDVASLVGLLYAWASYVKREAAKQGGNPKREVVKLLDNLESPNTVTYVAAYTLNSTQATLFKQQDTHFIYEEAKRLLEEAGVPVQQDEKENLLVGKDDLDKVYVHLMGKYGQAEKSWKNFIYEVRLALASRFPEYIRSGKEE